MALPPLRRLLLLALAAAPLAGADAARTLPLAPTVIDEAGSRFIRFGDGGKAAFRYAGTVVHLTAENRGRLLRVRVGDEPDGRLVAAQGRFDLPLALPGGRTATAAFGLQMLDRQYCYIVGRTALVADDGQLGVALIDSDLDGVFATPNDELRVRGAAGWNQSLPRGELLVAGGRIWRLDVPAGLAAIALAPWEGPTAQATLALAKPAIDSAALRLVSADGRLTVDLDNHQAPSAMPAGAYRILSAGLGIDGGQVLRGEDGRIELPAGATAIPLTIPTRLDFAGGVFEEGALVQVDAPGLVDGLGIRYRIDGVGSEMKLAIRLGGEERPVGKLEYG